MQQEQHEQQRDQDSTVDELEKIQNILAKQKAVEKGWIKVASFFLVPIDWSFSSGKRWKRRQTWFAFWTLWTNDRCKWSLSHRPTWFLPSFFACGFWAGLAGQAALSCQSLQRCELVHSRNSFVDSCLRSCCEQGLLFRLCVGFFLPQMIICVGFLQMLHFTPSSLKM